MITSLRAIFDKVHNLIVGEQTVNAVSPNEFELINAQMKERGCDLDLVFRPPFGIGYMEDIGFVVDENTSVYEIMHAEGNLEDVFEIVTGRSLDRDNLKQYSPEDKPPIYYIPMMF